MMGAGTLFGGALMLTAVNLLLRFAGTAFQVWLTGRIGAAGIGLLSLLLAFSTLKRNELYKSWLHGQGHIERVIMLGALIAMGEGFSMDDTRLALFCCSYHDIGRSNDRRDDDHGTVSAGMIIAS